MRDVRHGLKFLAKLPLDIAMVRESIHKRTEYEANLPALAPSEPQQRRTDNRAPASSAEQRKHCQPIY
jgi:hypothetical protein